MNPLDSQSSRETFPLRADDPLMTHSQDERVSRLVEIARQIRIDIVTMVYEAGASRKGHPGPALSITDIVTTLFFDVMLINPEDPQWPDRDRFILSKGHASPVLYAALANRGFFGKEQYSSYRRINGMLQGHPDMKNTPGIDMTTGSLGHGLAAGVGMALSAMLDLKNYHVYVLLGDGECQEGLVWEAVMASARYKLENLIAIVDQNDWQSCGTVQNTIPIEPFASKWLAFGWNVIEIDGHNMAEILAALVLAKSHCSQPTVIIAHTVKGKGISYMENNNDWHQKAPNQEQYLQAMAELKGGR